MTEDRGMTREQEAAAEMREKAAQYCDKHAARFRDSETEDGYYEDGHYDAAYSLGQGIRALPLPKAKPDPRRAALAKAKEGLSRIQQATVDMWAARAADKTLSDIEDVLNGHFP